MALNKTVAEFLNLYEVFTALNMCGLYHIYGIVLSQHDSEIQIKQENNK